YRVSSLACYCLPCSPRHRDLHSFPTRRSSDLEPQIIRRDDRARLLYVRTQNLFESRVQKVRRRMIPPSGVAFCDIDERRNNVADLNRTFLDRNLVNDEPRNRRESIGDRRSKMCSDVFCWGGMVLNQHTLITNLSTGLCVERRVVEHDARLLAFLQRIESFVAGDDRNDLRILKLGRLVTVKDILTDRLKNLCING